VRSSIALIAGLMVVGAGHTMEVKGITLGVHTSLKEMSAKFGHADCPDPKSFGRMDAVLPDMSGTRTLACHVPTTYLGFAGTATVYVDRGFMVKGLSFPIPQGQEEAAAAVLEKKYGAPDARRGDPMELTGFDNENQPKTTMSKEPCARWKRVLDASVTVCPGEVTYTYVGSAAVNPNDL